MDAKEFKSEIAKGAMIDTKTVDRLIEALAKVISQGAETLTSVSVPSFGSFVPVKYNEEVRTDLTSGKKIMFPPHIDIEFHPASSLRKKITDSNEQ